MDRILMVTDISFNKCL